MGAISARREEWKDFDRKASNAAPYGSAFSLRQVPVMETKTQTIQRPKTVMEEQEITVQEPRTIMETKQIQVA